MCLLFLINFPSFLSLFSYQFSRFDDSNYTRGGRRERRLCNYFQQNEILNEQLLRIKSAQTVNEFEKLLLRHHKDRGEGISIEKFIEPYYDFKEILRDKTCLRTLNEGDRKYRSKSNQLFSDKFNSSLPLTIASTTSSSAIHHSTRKFNEFDLKVDDNTNSINAFIRSATECYENCINCYRNNLDRCNQKAEIAEQQSENTIGERLTLKVRRIDDSTLANQINKISIGSSS